MLALKIHIRLTILRSSTWVLSLVAWVALSDSDKALWLWLEGGYWILGIE